MQRALALDASPPLSFSLRFFITAPLFVIFAAFILLVAGPQALSSRWHPTILAITHLLVLGTLAQTMIGALLQILPVATGITVFQSRPLVRLIHISLNAGALLLAAAFLSGSAQLFFWASCLLALSFGSFMFALAWGLWRDRHQQTKGAPTILLAVRLALLSLFVTILLGLFLSTHMIFNWPLHRWLTNLHAGWGLFGWLGLLLLGISYEVIRIFHFTERFPDLTTKYLAAIIFALLIGLSFGLFSGQSQIISLFSSAIFLSFAAYALVALNLLRHRKRPHPDTTTLFWLTAFFCLLFCLLIWTLQSQLRSPDLLRQLPLTLGFLAIFGFAWSAINGMLYTILPFLLWYNAQRNAPIVIRGLPKVREYLSDTKARPQYYLHLLTVFSLGAATLYPRALLYLAATVCLSSIIWLYRNIFLALSHYRQALQHIALTVQKANK